jgi:hypothetical protein
MFAVLRLEVRLASWFWPIAILDPKTGKLDLLPQGTSYNPYTIILAA